MNNINKKLSLISLLLPLLSLTACSDKAGQENSSNDTAPTLADAMSDQGKAQAAANALPQGDKSTPDNAYSEITSGEQIAFIYYGLAKMPVDYAKVAEIYPDYRYTNDEFKKQDLLNALKPKIDQEIAKGKATQYYKIKWDNFSLEQYDFNAKGFPQNQISPGTSFGWSETNYRITFSNSDEFKLLKVEDEAKARVIAEKRSKYQSMHLIAYGYAQEADLTDHTVKLQIQKVVLTDKNGIELMSQTR
jgi:hypothetical protein